MLGAVSQGHVASSSWGGFSPSSQSRLQDTTHLLGLNLPPNTLRIIAQCQASGGLQPALLNRPVQQTVPGATRPAAMTKARSTAWSHWHSQPNLLKNLVRPPTPVGSSPPGQLHSSPRQSITSPRSRRSAAVARCWQESLLARKSEGKATAPAAYGTVTDPNPSCGDRGKTASLLTLASVSAAQAAISQGKETPKTASGGPPPTRDGGTSTSMSASYPLPSHSALANAISQQPGLEISPSTS